MCARVQSSRAAAYVLTAMLAVFALARVLICLKGTVISTPDTASYVARTGTGQFDRGTLISLLGDAPRLWGTPLFYAAFPTDTWRAVAQVVLGTLAWGLLAWTVWGLLRNIVVRTAAAGAILLLALLPQVTSWDMLLLSESLTISLGVLSLALLLRWLTAGSPWLLVALTVVTTWWIFVRPELRVLAIGIVVVLIVRAWRVRGERLSAAIAVGVLLLGMVWVSAITPRMSATYAQRSWNGLNLEESTLTYRLRLTVMNDPAILQVYHQDLGMPACPDAEAIARGSAWKMNEFQRAYLACPDLVAWGRDNALISNVRFAGAAPGLFMRQSWHSLPAEVGGGTRTSSTRLLPTTVDRLAFSPDRRGALVLFGLLALALAAGGFGRRKLLFWAGAGVAVACGLSTLADLTLAAGEFDRFGIQEAIGFRLALIMLVAAVIDSRLLADKRAN